MVFVILRCGNNGRFFIASSHRLGRSRPVSRVLFLVRGGSHQSRPAVAGRLERSTRKHRAGRPQALSYLILLRIGFTKLPPSPGVLVGSYPTFSPLPPEKRTPPGRLCLFCGTFLRVTPTPRYGVPCPVEPGLSSLPAKAGTATAQSTSAQLFVFRFRVRASRTGTGCNADIGAVYRQISLRSPPEVEGAGDTPDKSLWQHGRLQYRPSA